MPRIFSLSTTPTLSSSSSSIIGRLISLILRQRFSRLSESPSISLIFRRRNWTNWKISCIFRAILGLSRLLIIISYLIVGMSLSIIYILSRITKLETRTLIPISREKLVPEGLISDQLIRWPNERVLLV